MRGDPLPELVADCIHENCKSSKLYELGLDYRHAIAGIINNVNHSTLKKLWVIAFDKDSDAWMTEFMKKFGIKNEPFARYVEPLDKLLKLDQNKITIDLYKLAHWSILKQKDYILDRLIKSFDININTVFEYYTDDDEVPIKIFRSLKGLGYNPDKKRSNGKAPLHIILSRDKGYDRIAKVTILLSWGANANVEDSKMRVPLDYVFMLNRQCFYILNEEHKLAKLLVDKGANIHRLDKKGNTYLIRALKKNLGMSMVKLFVDNGINVNSQNKNGDSALYVACKNNDYKGAKYLLEHSANVNVRNIDGETPLHRLVMTCPPGSYKLVRLLIAYNVDLNAKDKGKTALRYAQLTKNKKIISLLEGLDAKI